MKKLAGLALSVLAAACSAEQPASENKSIAEADSQTTTFGMVDFQATLTERLHGFVPTEETYLQYVSTKPYHAHVKVSTLNASGAPLTAKIWSFWSHTAICSKDNGRITKLTFEKEFVKALDKNQKVNQEIFGMLLAPEIKATFDGLNADCGGEIFDYRVTFFTTLAYLETEAGMTSVQTGLPTASAEESQASEAHPLLAEMAKKFDEGETMKSTVAVSVTFDEWSFRDPDQGQGQDLDDQDPNFEPNGIP